MTDGDICDWATCRRACPRVIAGSVVSFLPTLVVMDTGASRLLQESSDLLSSVKWLLLARGVFLLADHNENKWLDLGKFGGIDGMCAV
ncbi:hypothetical protein RRG08_053247 [Elysia crispata]|uniref:Uncharacterized protein n=1 Tax=Elysia crispata TaxID=231223 RepID=A0AAE1ANF1_9GAST|nr:hypothetical protein RRG08_053247 [Elysia crispata]